MSNVVIQLPDDGWFQPGCGVEPEDKMLCVVMHKYGGRAPEICQFRKADWLNKDYGYFLDVGERWRLAERDCADEWEPGFLMMSLIDYWKPLGLPAEANQRLLKEIESWFEEDE